MPKEISQVVQSTNSTPSPKPAIRWNNKEISIFSAGTGFAFGISGALIGTLFAPGLGTLVGFVVGVAVGILFGAITTTRHNNSDWNSKPLLHS